MRYFGPFCILQHIGSIAYKLELPPEARIHPVFHVSFLKPCIGDPSDQYIPLPLLTTVEGLAIQHSKILDARRIKVRNDWEIQVFVQWEGTDHCTWESWHSLQQQFPHLDLEDKVYFEGGRNAILRPFINTNQNTYVANKPENGEGLHETVKKSNRIRKLPERLSD